MNFVLRKVLARPQEIVFCENLFETGLGGLITNYENGVMNKEKCIDTFIRLVRGTVSQIAEHKGASDHVEIPMDRMCELGGYTVWYNKIIKGKPCLNQAILQITAFPTLSKKVSERVWDLIFSDSMTFNMVRDYLGYAIETGNHTFADKILKRCDESVVSSLLEYFAHSDSSIIVKFFLTYFGDKLRPGNLLAALRMSVDNKDREVTRLLLEKLKPMDSSQNGESEAIALQIIGLVAICIQRSKSNGANNPIPK